MTLRGLDDRLLPRLARSLRDAVETVVTRGRQVSEALRGAAATVRTPVAPLQRLDDRFARRGILGLLGEIPQLGLLLIAAVFFAGAGVALARSGAPGGARQLQAALDATTPNLLGPPPGSRVAAYVEQTRRHSVMIARTDPDGVYTALVSFAAYRTPEQAGALLGKLRVSEVLAHLAVPNAEVFPIPVTSGLLPDVRAQFATIVKRRLQDRREFTNLASRSPAPPRRSASSRRSTSTPRTPRGSRPRPTAGTARACSRPSSGARPAIWSS